MQCKAILYEILSAMQTEYNSKYMSEKTVSLIMPAVKYIHTNYTKKDIMVPELSEICGISEDYFRKLFKTIFGTSPVKYINDLKINYAKELINSGMYSVTEAAEMSGYTDMSYFSRAFKKHTGIPPSKEKPTLRNSLF